MTQTSYPWDGQVLGDATIAPYDAGEWVELWRKLSGAGTVFVQNGLIQGTGGGTYEPLAVNASSPTSVNVEVAPGSALAHDRLYSSSAVEALAVSANASGNPRIDTVVLRTDYVLQTTRLAIKVGTPAGSPTPPALQQDASMWEMALADIAVANGFATISQANITPRAHYIHSAARGWVSSIYPIGYGHTGAFTSSSVSTGGADVVIAIPFSIPGNLKIAQIRFILQTTHSSVQVRWGLYIQDTNIGGETSDFTLRRVAQSDGTKNFSGNAGDTITHAALQPSIVPPGQYWLAIQQAAANGLILGAQLPTQNLTTVNVYRFSPGASLSQLTDFSNESVHFTLIPGVSIDGLPFGRSTVLS